MSREGHGTQPLPLPLSAGVPTPSAHPTPDPRLFPLYLNVLIVLQSNLVFLGFFVLLWARDTEDLGATVAQEAEQVDG